MSVLCFAHDQSIKTLVFVPQHPYKRPIVFFYSFSLNYKCFLCYILDAHKIYNREEIS